MLASKLPSSSPASSTGVETNKRPSSLATDISAATPCLTLKLSPNILRDNWAGVSTYETVDAVGNTQ